MNKVQLTKLGSLVVAISGAVLAESDTIKVIPHLPGWLVNAWPIVLSAAVIIHHTASIFGTDVKIESGNQEIRK